jgi:FkbM family methyltransferase
LTPRRIAFPWLAQLYAARNSREVSPQVKNPVIAGIEKLAFAFNGLGIWRGEQLVWGKRMQARTFDRSLYLLMHRMGIMGAQERRILGSFIRAGMTVVDVGANLGLYSLAMADVAGPAGRVISFEPDPDLCSLLRTNCAANRAANIEAVQAALGRASDKMTLHRLTLNSGGNHLGSQNGGEIGRTVLVEVAAFDSLFPGVRPDFIKVDVQGWELNVLRGMERTLAASDPVIFLEFWPEGLRRAGNSPGEMFSLVRDLGFRLYSCDGWAELDESSFVAMAARFSGSRFVNLISSRSRPGSQGARS